MARVQKSENNCKKIIIVHLSASSRFWRWQARQQGRVVASQSGILKRPCSPLEAFNFCKIKAQQWQDDNQCLNALMVYEQPINSMARRAA